jgi:hypothetical protein
VLSRPGPIDDLDLPARELDEAGPLQGFRRSRSPRHAALRASGRGTRGSSGTRRFPPGRGSTTASGRSAARPNGARCRLTTARGACTVATSRGFMASPPHATVNPTTPSLPIVAISTLGPSSMRVRIDTTASTGKWTSSMRRPDFPRPCHWRTARAAGVVEALVVLFGERLQQTVGSVASFGNAASGSQLPLSEKGPLPICSRTVVTGGLVSVRRCQLAPSTTSACPEMNRPYGDARKVAAHPSS